MLHSSPLFLTAQGVGRAGPVWEPFVAEVHKLELRRKTSGTRFGVEIGVSRQAGDSLGLRMLRPLAQALNTLSCTL